MTKGASEGERGSRGPAEAPAWAEPSRGGGCGGRGRAGERGPALAFKAPSPPPRFRLAPARPGQPRVKWVRRGLPQCRREAPGRWSSCEEPDPLPPRPAEVGGGVGGRDGRAALTPFLRAVPDGGSNAARPLFQFWMLLIDHPTPSRRKRVVSGEVTGKGVAMATEGGRGALQTEFNSALGCDHH